ncbi:DUF3800 domain-containing protein [bacterium]|nr:DUF3800 domain-containing protein [bacterium]
MKIFIDESGDTGVNKITSSRFFVLIALMIADDYESQFQTVLKQLKINMGVSENFEWHFAHNTKQQRGTLIKTIDKMNFAYVAVIIDKSRLSVSDRQNLKNKQAFYQFVY